VALWALGFVRVSVRAQLEERAYFSTPSKNLKGYFPDVIFIRAYLCDVALNDVLCDNLRDFHALVANKRQFVFGGLCRSANGIACPLLLIFSV
jgi:hypothetical protein